MEEQNKQDKQIRIGNISISQQVGKLVLRFVIASVLFIVGFNFSNSVFFYENPLFGVQFLAEFLISTVAWLVGFFLIPQWMKAFVRWFEEVIQNTVTKIVTDFWNEQSQKIQESRKERDKKKQEEDEQKRKDNFVGKVLLDTSVVIDGRILEMAKVGFYADQLVVLQSVIDELQLLADSDNDEKRKRGRRGLEILNKLKSSTKLIICEEVKLNGQGVDKQIVNFAKKYKMNVMTMDYNLNKVARLSSVRVLNINELVEAVKNPLVPGDKLEVKIIEKGKEKNQGVGYLEDGTMVVVNNGSSEVGKKVKVSVTKIIQSTAGKMVFSGIDGNNSSHKEKSRK